MWYGFLIPVVAAAAILAGCGGKDEGGSGTGGGDHSGSGSGSGSGEGDKKAAKLLPIDARGSISGKVVAKGVDKDAIAANDKKFMDNMQTAEFKECHAANAEPWETKDQKWYIGDGDGLENAVVWLAPPEGYTGYKLTSDDLDSEKAGWKKEKKIDQPHCAFRPHVSVLFAQYRDDAGKLKETGQKLVLVNDAVVQHNTKITDAGGYDAGLIPPGKTAKPVPMMDFKPSTKQAYTVNCNIHSWMTAYVWSLDHPFAAVTDKDGKFEIKNAPAGVDLHLMVWHESESKPRDLGKVKLEKDKNYDQKDVEVEFKK
jgi:hypothetical protein